MDWRYNGRYYLHTLADMYGMRFIEKWLRQPTTRKLVLTGKRHARYRMTDSRDKTRRAKGRG